VELSLTGTPLTATTNVNGDYSFPSVPTLPSASYQLVVRRYGYVVPLPFPVTVVASAAVTKDIRLKPAAQYENFATHTGWTVTNDPATTSGLWTLPGGPPARSSVRCPLPDGLRSHAEPRECVRGDREWRRRGRRR
jgi:hypothetical protein